MLFRLAISVVLIGGLFSTASFAADEAPTVVALSFDTFLQKVLAYYPRLKAAHSDVDAALARAMQAEAGFWPSLGLVAGYQVTNDPVNVFGTLLRQERFTTSDFDLKRLNTPDRQQDLSAGIHVEIPLFDSLQTIGRARSARENLKAVESEETFTKMEAVLMAEDAYLSALTLEALSTLIEEVRKSSEEDLQKAKDLKEKGMILGADYYSARVMFGEFTRMGNELTRQKKATTVLLNILMGESPEKTWEFPASLKEADVLARDPAELLTLANAERPDLLALGRRLKAAEADLSREKATAWPTLRAFGDAIHDGDKIGASGGSNYTVGIKAELSVFDASRNGRVKEALARKERLEHDIQIFKDGISRDVAEESARHEALRDNVSVLKGMASDAKEAVALMGPLYSEGRKSIADLLNVRRSYLSSAQAYQEILRGLWMSEGRLLFLTGRLNEEEMNKLAEEGWL